MSNFVDELCSYVSCPTPTNEASGESPTAVAAALVSEACLVQVLMAVDAVPFSAIAAIVAAADAASAAGAAPPFAAFWPVPQLAAASADAPGPASAAVSDVPVPDAPEVFLVVSDISRPASDSLCSVVLIALRVEARSGEPLLGEQDQLPELFLYFARFGRPHDCEEVYKAHPPAVQLPLRAP